MAEQAEQRATAAGDRGSLTVADRVIERLATIAALEVDGVVRTGSAVDRALGRQYPKAEAHVAGGHARVTVEVAVRWPAPLADLAGHVRDQVRDSLTTLANVQVDAVDVVAAKMVIAATTPRRRVQ